MKIIWFEEAWEDYVYWQMQDKKTIKRINQLLQDTTRNGYWYRKTRAIERRVQWLLEQTN